MPLRWHAPPLPPMARYCLCHGTLARSKARQWFPSLPLSQHPLECLDHILSDGLHNRCGTERLELEILVGYRIDTVVHVESGTKGRIHLSIRKR